MPNATQTTPTPLTRFQIGQRVTVLPAIAELRQDRAYAALAGQSGTVVWQPRADNSAWVAMDAPLPHELRHYDDGRSTQILLYPDECTACTEATQ